MPTVYKRKPGVKPRGQWSIDTLQEAVMRLKAGEIGLRQAERYYGIPTRTLKRKMLSGKIENSGQGPTSTFGPENEKRLVNHIYRLCEAGFSPDRTSVRRMAFEFAEALKLDHKFNRETKLAGYDWLWSFLRRNSNLSIRKEDGLSMGLNREAANKFYDILGDQMKTHNLETKPQNIFNVDESSIQLINEVGQVITAKGSRTVHKLTTGEKIETISLVACCSADGRFLPPAIILKGKNFTAEFQDGLPPGSAVFMNPNSAYINTDLFYKWFKDIFIPCKAPGRNILILDGHCSHVSSIALLELADENDISLICLPPHTTHALQPLDKPFFGPFKAYFKNESNTWLERNIGRKLSLREVGPLLRNAWNRSASVGNGTVGFKSTGIFPPDRFAIPDHFFTISCYRTRNEDPTAITDAFPKNNETSNKSESTQTNHLSQQPSTSKGQSSSCSQNSSNEQL